MARPAKLGFLLPLLPPSLSFSTVLRAPSRAVIGRGRAFQLYGPVCTHVQARSCIVLVYQSAMHFSCFSPPPTPTLALASFHSFFRNRSSNPSYIAPPSPEPLDVPVSNRDARCSLRSRRRRTTDSCVRFSETPVERDGCRGA